MRILRLASKVASSQAQRQGSRPARGLWILAASVALFFKGAPPVDAQPVFTDVTSEAGLDYIQHHAAEPPDCLFGSGNYCAPERMSGAAAAGDADGDGRVDLYVTRLDGPDFLFQNQGDGTFLDRSVESGLAAFHLQSNGAAFGDVDNDDDLDLFVTTLGEQGDPVNGRYYLFVNDGAGRFTEEAQGRGLALETGKTHAGFSAACGDFDLDGWLDLHVTEWLLGGGCQGSEVSHNRLLRNLGVSAPGHFEDVTETAGVSLQASREGAPCGRWGFASAFTDLDGDGWPELTVVADFGTSRLFWNNGDGTFNDGTEAAGVGSDENGMGSTFGDIDGDGDLDWFVTSIHDPLETCDRESCNWGYSGNRLYRYEGSRTFSDATDWAGVREGYWGWGAAFFDADNDGDQDLVMTNGVDFPGAEDWSHLWTVDPMRFWVNDGSGHMREMAASAGLTDTASGKGLLTFDYDHDGDLDIFVVNNAGAPRLYRNDSGNSLGWLRVEVRGGESNRQGLGARVTVEVAPKATLQVREIGTASHFLGQSETAAHFGLGAGDEPVWRVVVEWPRSGTRQVLHDVARNSVLTVHEPLAQTGSHLPGDCNEDGTLNLTDGLCLLGFLFVGAPEELPCGVEGFGDPGGLLFDLNGDGDLDVSDPIYLIDFLFLAKPPPTPGTECVRVSACPDACEETP